MGLGVLEAGVLRWADGEAVADDDGGVLLRGMTGPRASADADPVELAAEWLFVGLVVGLAAGLAIGLVVGLVAGTVVGLVSGVVDGLLSGPVGDGTGIIVMGSSS